MSTSASLNATAYEALKARIVRGELRPGAPLSERALCDALAVSRTPLREALKRLANEGLVQISETRRARVARVSVDEVVNLLAVMAVLEDAAGHTQHRQSDQSQTSDFHQFPSVRMIPTK